MATTTQTRKEIDDAYVAATAAYLAQQDAYIASIPPINPNGRRLTDAQVIAQARLCNEERW